MIVDAFAGPGGWDIAARALGIETVGIEHDRDACATRGVAGLATIRADVSTWPLGPLAGRVDGLIASPPCQAFSLAGSQLGHLDLDRIYDAIRGWPEPWSLDVWNDARSALILEPLRWAWTLRPRWVACEQVKPCLPVWRALGEKLAEVGYRWWAGILNAADFGVPQTRERAIFIASLDRQPQPPAATHARSPQPTLFGAPLEPWVSMAEALGWTGEVGFTRIDDRGTSPDGYREQDWRSTDSPAFTLTEKARSWSVRGRTEPAPTVTGHRGPRWGYDGYGVVRTGANSMVTGRTAEDVQPYERSMDEPAPTVDAKAGGAWKLIAGNQENAAVRGLDEPAPAIAFGHNAAAHRFERTDEGEVGSVNTGLWWKKGGDRDDAQQRSGSAPAPAPALTAKSGGQWHLTRPATTVQGDSRLWPPGHKVNGDGAGTDAIRLSVEDGLLLQSFPADYPVQGTKTAQFRQIGDAVPPLLAYHVLRAAT